jgi:hypothetical protein
MKHLQYTFKTSGTLETYAYNMCFQQNMAVRRVEHGIMGSRLCGGGEGEWQRAGGCAALGDRAQAVPAVEATTTVGWCDLAQRARHDSMCGRGEHAVAVERKVCGRHNREGGVREPRRSRSWSGVAVTRGFFNLR